MSPTSYQTAPPRSETHSIRMGSREVKESAARDAGCVINSLSQERSKQYQREIRIEVLRVRFSQLTPDHSVVF